MHKSERPRQFRAAILLATLFMHTAWPSFVQAGNTWTGGGTTTNWTDNGNWGGSATSYGTLTFTTGGTQGTTSVLDSTFNMNQLLWTGSQSWTLNNSGGAVLNLFDNAGTAAKLENQSTGLVTINAPITFAATTGQAWGEINAVNGDMTFGSAGALTVNGSAVAGIKMFSAGRTINFNNTVSASGKWFATTGATGMTMNVGGAFTSGDLYIMNGSTLKLNTGGSISTSGLRLGGDFGNTLTQDLTKGATFQLTSTTGGQSFGSIINAVTGNTSGALLIDSLATSGTNTLSGNIFLDSAVTMKQAAGGTLAVSSVVSGAGALNKIGGGTLDLQAVNTITGALNVAGGTVKLAGAGTAASTSGVSFSNRGILTLDNSGTNNGNRTAGAISSGGGTINFIGNAAATTR
jgi:fibronectin-binding autotransporter adhesin